MHIRAVEFQKEQHYSGAEVYRQFLNTIHFMAINGKTVARGKL
jgi:PII-like signaling protein